MDENFIASLNNLKKELFEEPLIKEYFRLKKIIEKDEEINNLLDQIKYHQQKMAQNVSDDNLYFIEKDIYESLLNRYKNNPLIQNYEKISEEAHALLLEIKDILEEK